MKWKLTAWVLALLVSSPSHLRAQNPDRKSELARIEEETQVQKTEAEKAAADLLPQQKSLREKVAQKEKTLRDLTRRRRITGPTAQALGKLQSEMKDLDRQIRDRQQPYLLRLAELEQERRRVVKRFLEPGDPAYLEVAGKLYTQEEWDLAKTEQPGTVAEDYIKELLRTGIIRSANYTNTTRHAEPMDRGADGSPIRDFMNINYTVQYVSKGGVLNERNAWVTVVTLDGKHWVISQRMKDLEVLGGLP